MKTIDVIEMIWGIMFHFIAYLCAYHFAEWWGVLFFASFLFILKDSIRRYS